MSGRELAAALLGYHLVPCFLCCAALGLLIAVLFGLGRLRRPRYRVWFLYAALAKGALALWLGSGISCLVGSSPVIGHFSVRLPNLVPDGTGLDSRLLIGFLQNSGTTLPVVMGAIMVGLGALLWRWWRLAPLCWCLRGALSAEDAKYTGLASLFDELADRARARSWQLRLLAPPKLLLVSAPPGAAFTLGIRRPTVVISTALVEQLSRDELRGVLAHELAHVVRWDYLGRWLATITRDLLAWNPLAWLWHDGLVGEQELAADELAASLTGDPVSLASGLVEVAARTRRSPLLVAGPLSAWQHLRGRRALEHRIDALEWLITGGQHRAPATGAAARLALGGFLVVQPELAVCLPNLVAAVLGTR